MTKGHERTPGAQTGQAQAGQGQFGLWGYEETRDWPMIGQNEATEAFAFFGLDYTGPLVWHSARPFSAVVQARSPDGQDYFLKRHHMALRDSSALREEHALMTHLRRKGLPVASPIHGDGQESVYEAGIWRYECLPLACGHDLYRDRMSWESYLDDRQAMAAGRALAVFHEASAGFDAPSRSGRPLVSSLSPLLGPDPAQSLSDWITNRADLIGAFGAIDWQDRIFGALTPHLDRIGSLSGQFVPLWGHGDWHGSNLLWSKDGSRVLRPFDFGMADRTTRGFDIAVALERSMFGWLTPCAGGFPVHRSQIIGFLEGYCSVTPLTEADRQEIAVLLPLCHVVFALSEIWYYGALLHRPEAARTACFDYLIGHAAWFSSAEGRAVLDGIRTPENRGR